MTSEPDRSPGFFGYAGWSLAALFFFYAWILRVSPSVMVEQLMAEFAVSGVVLGNLSAFYFYAYAGLQMPVGIALDRWGPRKVLSLAVLVAGGGCLIFAVAPTVEVAYLGRLLIGAGCAFGLVGALVLAGNWFPARRFALLSGLAMAIGLAGGIFGQGPVAYVVDQIGWRPTILYLGVFALVLALLFWLMIRDRPPGQAVDAAESGDDQKASVAAGLWQVARHPQTIAIAIFTWLASAPMLAFGALWGVPFTMVAYDVSRPAAGFATSSLLFGFVLGGPAFGWFSDRIGRRVLPSVLGTLVGALSLAAAIYIPDLPFDLYRFLLFLSGFGGAGMIVCYALTREHNAGGATGAALGLVNMMAVAGGATFQPLIGWLLDLQWDGKMVGGARIYSLAAYENAFLTLLVAFAIAIAALLLVRETFCRPYEPAPKPAAA